MMWAKCGHNKYYKKYGFGMWIVFNCTVTVLFSVLIGVHFYNFRFINFYCVFFANAQSINSEIQNLQDILYLNLSEVI
jgi:hypothetical protein